MYVNNNLKWTSICSTTKEFTLDKNYANAITIIKQYLRDNKKIVAESLTRVY